MAANEFVCLEPQMDDRARRSGAASLSRPTPARGAGGISRLALGAAILFLAAGVAAQAAPFIPGKDDDVLERLPLAPSDPVLCELRALQAQLRSDPANLLLARRVARGYVDLGRATGDPRYVGYAQAALAPWWDMKQPPIEVLVMRAVLRQRVHRFDEALADLESAAQAAPRNVQIRLVRATVLQVVGKIDAAREECAAMTGARLALLRVACAASADSVSGRLSEGYAALTEALGRSSLLDAASTAWVQGLLAEMAARMGRDKAAEGHFRKALAAAPDDTYALGAYADFLLDCGRAQEAESLLAGRERVDPLLLRLALAADAINSGARAARVAQLRDRFEASRLRGDTVHLREEARFTLHLLGDPKTAARLARENWRVQKEPADLRLLAEAAIAANDMQALEAARDWRDDSNLEDLMLDRILSRGPQPD